MTSDKLGRVSRHAVLLVWLLACGCDTPASPPDGEPLIPTRAEPTAISEVRVRLTEGPPPAVSGALLFHSDRGGRNHLYRIDLGTGAMTTLTAGAEHHDEEPAPAPDGRRVAFTTTRFDHRTFDIAVMRADGTDVRRVTTDLAVERHPAWDADGRHLFLTGEDGGTQTLFRVALEGGAVARVWSQPERTLMPQPALDGRRVAYVMGTIGGLRAVIQDLSTGDLEAVTPDGHDAADPAWSADGTRVAYAHVWRGGSAIEATTLATGAVTRWEVAGLTTLREPAWSPDGRWLAAAGSVSAGADEDWDLVLLPAEGGAAYRITRGPAHDRAPAWLTP